MSIRGSNCTVSSRRSCDPIPSGLKPPPAVSPRNPPSSRRFLGEDNARGGGPRNDTDDHGKGDGVVLVLSAAVLVIVIDARDVGRWGWRAGVVDHDRHEFHEKGFGHTRTQRSGARSTLTGRPWGRREGLGGRPWGQSIWGRPWGQGLGDRASGPWELRPWGRRALGTGDGGPWGQSINHRGRAPPSEGRGVS